MHVNTKNLNELLNVAKKVEELVAVSLRLVFPKITVNY